MATVIGQAVVKLTVDPQGTRQEIQALNATIEAVERKRRELEKDKGDTKADDNKKVDAKKRELNEKKKRFSLPPLTAADVAGAIPFVGGLAKLSTMGVQRFGASAVGALEGLAASATDGLTGPAKIIMDQILAVTKDAVKEALDKVNDIDAFLKAFQPAFEQVKQVAKAQLLTSGEVDVTDIGGFLQNEFKIQEAQLRLRKSIQDETMRQLGSSGTKQLIEGLRKATSKN